MVIKKKYTLITTQGSILDIKNYFLFLTQLYGYFKIINSSLYAKHIQKNNIHFNDYAEINLNLINYFLLSYLVD